MRTDPRKACDSGREVLFWAFVHDLIAHGAMAIFFWAEWTLRFHNWTSEKAWPRKSKGQAVEGKWKEIGPPLSPALIFKAQEISPGIWRVRHPRAAHEYTTTAESKYQAWAKAYKSFCELSKEFGGKFAIDTTF
jgi:hypothetical protein